MKNTVFFIAFLSLVGCKKDKCNCSIDSETNTWKLTHVLADPGDGSGTFQPVSSDKTLTFNPNGTVESNGAICDMSAHTDSSTSGTFTSDGLSGQIQCPGQSFTIGFTIEGNILTADYPCFEPCRARFEKVE